MNIDYVTVNKKQYRVPDILDIIYDDLLYGLYSPFGNKSVTDRILMAKLNLSCDMLLNSNLTLMEISEELDFPDYDKFNEHFIKFLGILPNQFRKRFGNII